MSTNVYYSVSPFGTGDIKTGSPTLTISGGVSTLTVAQTGNIGIGCRITYDTSSIAYISAVNSSTSFDVITAVGGTPSDEGTPVTVNSIGHEYASLSAFEAGFTDANHINNTSLVSADVIANACCYYDHDDQTPDTAALVFNGTTTDAERYIHAYTPIGGTESINNQRSATGIKDLTKYALSCSTDYANTIYISSVQNIKLTGLQISNSAANGNVNAISLYSLSTLDIDKCIISEASKWHGVNIGGGTCNIKNTIIYDSTLQGVNIIFQLGAPTVNIYNSIITKSGAYGVLRSSGTVVITNCAIFNNTTGDLSGTATTTYTASDDTISGTGNIDWDAGATDWANNFTDYANDDYSLVSGGSCIDNGTDLSASGVTDDIIGTSRPQNSIYDIGAFEFISILSGIYYRILLQGDL